MQKHIQRLYSNYENDYNAVKNIPSGYEKIEIFIGMQKIDSQSEFRTDIICHMRLNCGCPDEAGKFRLVIARINPVNMQTSVLFNEDITWKKYSKQLYR